MIPKIIHYCWFGKKAIPEKHAAYIAHWSTVLIGYTFIKWNEENSPMQLPYMQAAYTNGNWANLSNFTRLWALSMQGGIYLDTDIEVLKTFDPLLNNKSFLGFEDVHVDWDGCVNNAVFGAIKDHPFVNEMKDRLLIEFNGSEKAHLSSPNFTTTLLKEKGLSVYKDQILSDVHLYPIEYFYPYSWHQKFTQSCIKNETFCIHHFEKSWVEEPAAKPIGIVLGAIQKVKGMLKRIIK